MAIFVGVDPQIDELRRERRLASVAAIVDGIRRRSEAEKLEQEKQARLKMADQFYKDSWRAADEKATAQQQLRQSGELTQAIVLDSFGPGGMFSAAPGMPVLPSGFATGSVQESHAAEPPSFALRSPAAVAAEKMGMERLLPMLGALGLSFEDLLPPPDPQDDPVLRRQQEGWKRDDLIRAEQQKREDARYSELARREAERIALEERRVRVAEAGAAQRGSDAPSANEARLLRKATVDRVQQELLSTGSVAGQDRDGKPINTGIDTVTARTIAESIADIQAALPNVATKAPNSPLAKGLQTYGTTQGAVALYSALYDRAQGDHVAARRALAAYYAQLVGNLTPPTEQDIDRWLVGPIGKKKPSRSGSF